MQTAQLEHRTGIGSVYRSPRATGWSALSRWARGIHVFACRFTGMSGLAFALATGSYGGLVINAGIGLCKALEATDPNGGWRDEAARRFYELRDRTLRVLTSGVHS